MSDVCAFSGHVGACDDEDVGGFGSELYVVGDEFGAEDFGEDRVFAVGDVNFFFGGDFGADVVSLFCQMCERCEAVAICYLVGEGLEAGDVFCGFGADFFVEF